MSGAACIGEPVSWLRLERLALAELDAATAATVRAHLDACAACAGAFARIAEDARPLPRLPAVTVDATAPPWWARWRVAIGGIALAAGAAVALVALRPATVAPPPPGGVRVKGAGVVVVRLVRERAGVIAFDPDDVREDDRWKVELTCAPGGAAWVDVAVVQGREVAFPLAPQEVACGNAVAVPGAFRITDGAAEVCVALGPRAADREKLRGGARGGVVCRRLTASGT
ncbi:MAG: zf-HC2 domain-containing protein [Myxococcales bacterium]|nr:zf-HC2 domain-containing protein [Myxococcales bacterium]